MSIDVSKFLRNQVEIKETGGSGFGFSLERHRWIPTYQVYLGKHDGILFKIIKWLKPSIEKGGSENPPCDIDAEFRKLTSPKANSYKTEELVRQEQSKPLLSYEPSWSHANAVSKNGYCTSYEFFVAYKFFGCLHSNSTHMHYTYNF